MKRTRVTEQKMKIEMGKDGLKNEKEREKKGRIQPCHLQPPLLNCCFRSLRKELWKREESGETDGGKN